MSSTCVFLAAFLLSILAVSADDDRGTDLRFVLRGIEGEPCDPAVHQKWYPHPHLPFRFLYCHSKKRVFVDDQCRREGTTRKVFDFAKQQCVLPLPGKNRTKEEHPMLARFGTIPFLGSGKAFIKSVETRSKKVAGPTLERPPPINACPGERTPLVDNDGKPVRCQASKTEEADDCGTSGYRCSFTSVLENSGVCCSQLSFAQSKCPQGMRPMIVPSKADVGTAHGQVKPCSPLTVGSCRAIGSLCAFDEFLGDYHCCEGVEGSDPQGHEVATLIMVLASGKANGSASAVRRFGNRTTSVQRKKPTKPTDNGCPKGMEVFKTSVAAAAASCQPGEVASCPPGFACFKSSFDGTHQCCGRRDICPENSAAFVNPISQAPVNCGAMAGCPEAFFCYMPSAGEHGTCCSLDVVSGLCGRGTSLLNERGRAVACDKVPCPVGFNCVTHFNVSFCCPNEENVCTQPAHRGLPCSAAPPQSAYHYSRGSGKCQKFVYSGCSGNDNRFESEDACERFCMNAVLCPRDSPLVDPDGRMTTCSATASCMPRYQCHITDRRSFCCRNPDLSEACPRGQRPFVDVADVTPMVCDGDALTAQCPNSYKCAWNTVYKHGYCCTSASPLAALLKRTEENFDLCDDGSEPHRRSGKATSCNPNVGFACPIGFHCTRNTFLGRFQCCPLHSVPFDQPLIPMTRLQQACPAGMELVTHPRTGGAVLCDPHNSQCPPFSSCKYSVQQWQYMCCSYAETKLMFGKDNHEKVHSGIYPGQAGCIEDAQCTAAHPNTTCADWTCKCPAEQVAWNRACVRSCPGGYDDFDGLCKKLNRPWYNTRE